MNASDARVIGASAVTAAAVALLTVIVYEGHVKVAREGQTVIIEPGSTYRAGEPPAPARAPSLVGGGPTTSEADKIERECKQAVADRKWQDLLNCANQLAELDRGRAKVYMEVAKSEQKAEIHFAELENAIKDGDLGRAGKMLDAIDTSSVYRVEAEGKFEAFETTVVQQFRAKAKQLADKQQCDELEALGEQAARLGAAVAKAVSGFSCNAPPANCSVDKLVEAGANEEAIGQHAAALASFELAIQCKPGPRLDQLAFMAACNASNVAKAREYFQKLTPTVQQHMIEMCIRGSITREQLMVTTGYLQVYSKPAAKVWIDGKDTGLTTPIAGKKLELSSGKHKYTLVVGADRFTYPVTIKTGETVTTSKDLR